MQGYRVWRQVFTILALATLLSGFVVACSPGGEQAEPVSLQSVAEEQAQLDAAPAFELTNQDGQRVRLSDFRGKVVLMHFIYTQCTTVCPLENLRLKEVYDALEEPLRDDLVLISVSFDPLDTPEVLNEYASARGYDLPGWVFLTGSEEEIRQVTSDYNVFYALAVESSAHEEGTGSHTQAHGDHARQFMHGGGQVLIDRKGMIRKEYFELNETPAEDILQDVKALLTEGATLGLPKGSAGDETPAASSLEEGFRQGEELFAQMGCPVCHKIRGQGGEVGPDLSDIGARHDAAYVREAIIDPGATLAEGFAADLMPTHFGDKLSGEQLELLVEYLANLKGQ